MKMYVGPEKMFIYQEISQTCYFIPMSSRGGDHNPIPIKFGMTRTSPPLTPDFAGRPTLNANSPE